MPDTSTSTASPRPALPFYWPKGVSRDLRVPRITLDDNLSASAQRYPDKAAIIYAGASTSYAQLLAQVEALAGFLQQRLQLAPGQRVLLQSQNCPQFVIACYAIFRAGGVVVPVSAMTTGNSSLAYTPSQLDAGDVDPVAEADVYLAYGRDLQAEEILKEALRTSPTRSALHAKLAEIYAKRKDRLALESIAKDARQLTGGTGPDWLRIAALGQELDAANPIYQNNTAAVPSAAEIATPAALAAAAAAARAEPIPFENTLPPTTMAASSPASAFSPSTGLDFAMSSQLTETPDAASQFQAPAAPAAPVAAPAAPAADAGLAFEALAPAAGKPALSMEDFDRQLAEALSIPSELSPSASHSAAQSLETQPGSLDFQLSDFDSQSTAQMPIGDKSMPTMDFDMTSLSLDLPSSGEPDHTHPVTLADDMAGLEIDDSDPLATKLTLAQEFLAIGDKEGARSLAEEVMAESSSATVKAQAQRLLDQSR